MPSALPQKSSADCGIIPRMDIRELNTDKEVMSAFDPIATLRDRIRRETLSKGFAGRSRMAIG